MAGIGQGVAHAVIGHAAAFFVEVVLPRFEGGEEIGEGLNILAELVEPGIEENRAIDEEGFVRAEGGVNLGGAIRGIGGVVTVEIIGRIVGGADGIDAEFSQEALR